MFDSALAFERYRLEVVRSWPDSAVKDQLLASIECSLRRNGQGLEHFNSPPRSGELDLGMMRPSTAPRGRFLPEIEQVTGT